MSQQDFIAPGSYVDSDAANVIAFARDAAEGADSDLLLPPFARRGRLCYEYINGRGAYADVPFNAITAAFRVHSPKLMTNHGLEGDFQVEAIAGATVRQTA